MDVRGKKVLVVGAARSGLAAARLLASHGAAVTVNDLKPEPQLEAEAAQLRDFGAQVAFGSHPEELFIGADLIVLSPGIPTNIPPLEAARRARVEVISEVELAGRFLRGRLIGITGSNGKTTTTTLTGELMRAAGADTLVVGNIGTPFSSMVEQTRDNTWTVAELSSFQLEAIKTLRVNVAIVTNITPDHLDRHPTFADYVRAKHRIFLNQTEADAAVLNGLDPAIADMVAALGVKARTFYFSSRGPSLPSGGRADIYVRDGAIYTTMVTEGGAEVEVMPLAKIPLRGMHNVENIMAALAAVFCALGAREDDLPVLRDAIANFKGVEHRIEFVAEINGARYYNDSKATNVDSTVKALEAFDNNIILILGGKDKGSDFTALAPLIRERVKRLILIGAASEKIAKQLEGVCPQTFALSMAEAVRLAADAAVAGDTVLLAPACASFDMFDNYEHRGRVFKEEVRRLIDHYGEE
ncbi:MAG TPA: UDP-N-acetylmuramoyl-L-alanine--D-glutamate ligase [Blastocatellia bacterium]|nr:UDP-N-acetylmuramoyl-L-alanine--D-glutamate ligase [Blastocatellia bacterium]